MGLLLNPFDPRIVKYMGTEPNAFHPLSVLGARRHPQLSLTSAAITVRRTFLAAARSLGSTLATSPLFRDSTTLTTSSAYDRPAGVSDTIKRRASSVSRSVVA